MRYSRGTLDRRTRRYWARHLGSRRNISPDNPTVAMVLSFVPLRERPAYRDIARVEDVTLPECWPLTE
ncbi:hypothetical protein ABQF34_29495 [Mycolicibacterium boenickei]